MKKASVTLRGGVLPTKIKNICVHRDLYMNIVHSFIHNRQTLEQQMFIRGEEINKLWYIPRVECYSALKRKEF